MNSCQLFGVFDSEDKILELKELCSRDDIKYIVDNYKILDEYKFLYLKIDKLEEDYNYMFYASSRNETIKNTLILSNDFADMYYNVKLLIDVYKNYANNERLPENSGLDVTFAGSKYNTFLSLTMFYNLPFELIGIRVSDILIIIATVFAVVSGCQYYMNSRQYFIENK